MRAKCAMYGCKNASYNRYGYMLNFHRFPKDPERCMVWRNLCKNPRIMKINYTSLFVCGYHFDKSSFTNQVLKNTAVPNMNLPKKALGLFSMSQNNSTEGATEFNNGTIEVTVPNDDSINLEEEHTEEVSGKEVKLEVYSEDEESDSSKLLDGSDDESNSSQQSRSVTISQSAVNETFTPRITSVNSLAPSTSHNPASTDEIDDSSTFADFVKARMRSFDPVQRAIAQKLISDVMFLAGTRQLQFGTAVLNPVVTGPQITIDRTGPAVNSSPQIVAQARLTGNNGAKKSGSFSAYVVNDDSDDDVPLAKRSTNNI